MINSNEEMERGIKRYTAKLLRAHLTLCVLSAHRPHMCNSLLLWHNAMRGCE
jgi:hypothetical protein